MDWSDFHPVTFQKEIDQIKTDLRTKVGTIDIVADDGRQLTYRVLATDDETFKVEPARGSSTTSSLSAAKAVFRQDQDIQILFSTSEGLYSFRSALLSPAVGSVLTLKFPAQFFRLQRRENFRVQIYSGSKVGFVVESLGVHRLPARRDLSLVDLSASGACLVWPQDLAGVLPAVGESLRGSVSLPGGDQVGVSGVVRSLASAPGGSWRIGVEFQNIGQAAEQRLLFTCLQIRRRQLR